MSVTTPKEISAPILGLCRELVQKPTPVFLDVTPAASAIVNDCFPVVERQVRAHGGAICYGWQVWEWPKVMIEAEFHAVWRDEHGRLHDLTPKFSGANRTLFLPDPVRVYEGKQVNNVRRHLSPEPAIVEYIAAADAEFEFLNRGARATRHAVFLKDDDSAELKEIKARRRAAFADVIRRHPPGRNDPCPCQSGKKFKRCHGA